MVLVEHVGRFDDEGRIVIIPMAELMDTVIDDGDEFIVFYTKVENAA